jgi:hypothetical protein
LQQPMARKRTTLYINISDLSACLGLHPHVPRDSMLQRYRARLAGQPVQTAVQVPVGVAEASAALQVLLPRAHSYAAAIREVAPEDTPVLEHLRMACGKAAEGSVLQACERHLGLSAGALCKRSPRFESIQVGTLGGVQVHLGGCPDAVLDACETHPRGLVVEAKTRTGARGLLGMQAHDEIQLQAYMHTLDIPCGILAEAEGCDAYAFHDASFDEALWTGCVVPGLRAFTAELLE